MTSLDKITHWIDKQDAIEQYAHPRSSHAREALGVALDALQKAVELINREGIDSDDPATRIECDHVLRQIARNISKKVE